MLKKRRGRLLEVNQKNASPRGRALPDSFDSCRLEAAVAGDKWNAKVKRRRGNNAVWHVGHDIAWYILECSRDIGIYGGDE